MTFQRRRRRRRMHFFYVIISVSSVYKRSQVYVSIDSDLSIYRMTCFANVISEVLVLVRSFCMGADVSDKSLVNGK